MKDDHRWSGWPGAYCMDCGIPDPREMALATDRDDLTEFEELMLGICLRKGLGLHDPYYDASSEMTLEEAITHCLRKSMNSQQPECAKEHLQLAEWLGELKEYREKTGGYIVKVCTKPLD